MRLAVAIVTVLGLVSQAWCSDQEPPRGELAQRFFRGVYGGDPSVVDQLAAADIVVTYPIFAEVLGTAAIRGRESLRDFVSGFSQRWAEPEFTFHETIADGDRVVLVWSYSARRIAPLHPGEPAPDDIHKWGGITLYRFNSDGKIVAEIGEESAPGPMARMQQP